MNLLVDENELISKGEWRKLKKNNNNNRNESRKK